MTRQPISQPIEGGSMMLLPAREGTCEICATAHEAQLPHNAQSLFYQTRFQMEHGRAPDWRDALAHCTEELKAAWTAELTRMGIDVEAGQISPARGPR